MESPESPRSQSKGVALVTGAARGLGRAIALRLADDGFDVAVNDLPKMPDLEKVAKEIEAKGRRAIATPGDVSMEPVVTDMIQKTVRELGGLDVVCELYNHPFLPSFLYALMTDRPCRSADGG
jgi:NAD(P)-dependent dehydrogenase (short-subunit alcohol dehydrogenase family)